MRARCTETDEKTGKRVRREQAASTETTDLNEAKRRAAVYEADLNGTAVSVDDPTVMQVVAARVKALELDPQAEPGTLKKYRRLTKALAAVPLAAVRASELSRRHVIEGRDAIKAGGQDGRSNSTVNSTMVFFASCWKWALEREQVRSPWPRIDPLDESKPARPKRAYTPDEVAAVLDHVREHDPDWHPPFALLAATGARLNDVLTLRCADVQRGQQVVMLRDPKTHDPVEVGVPADVLALLPERAPTAYLFPSARTGAHLTDSGALRCLRRALRALKVPDADWLDLHSFRRAWCADAEDAGVSRHQAMKQTGHKEGAMFDLYASKARSRKRETAERVHAYRQRSTGRESAPSGAAIATAPEAFPAPFPTGENGAHKDVSHKGDAGCQKMPAILGRS